MCNAMFVQKSSLCVISTPPRCHTEDLFKFIKKFHFHNCIFQMCACRFVCLGIEAFMHCNTYSMFFRYLDFNDDGSQNLNTFYNSLFILIWKNLLFAFISILQRVSKIGRASCRERV